MAKHIAKRVSDVFGEGQCNVLDAFSGVGGNLIQFARKCGFCVGSDMDPLKVDFAKHNSQIYNLNIPNEVQVVHTDFLKLQNNQRIPQFYFPEMRPQ